MAVEDIYSRITQHMIRGMMIHEQLANYYDFLGLYGYSKCHEYHYLEETKSFRSVNKFFIKIYNKLIPELPVDSSSIIPPTWFQYTRQDVDNETKKRAVQNGLQTWVNWEEETKNLYQSLYIECFNEGQIIGAMKIKELIQNVKQELCHVKQYHLNKKMIDYDMKEIVSQQKMKEKTFKKKIEQVD